MSNFVRVSNNYNTDPVFEACCSQSFNLWIAYNEALNSRNTYASSIGTHLQSSSTSAAMLRVALHDAMTRFSAISKDELARKLIAFDREVSNINGRYSQAVSAVEKISHYSRIMKSQNSSPEEKQTAAAALSKLRQNLDPSSTNPLAVEEIKRRKELESVFARYSQYLWGASMPAAMQAAMGLPPDRNGGDNADYASQALSRAFLPKTEDFVIDPVTKKKKPEDSAVEDPITGKKVRGRIQALNALFGFEPNRNNQQGKPSSPSTYLTVMQPRSNVKAVWKESNRDINKQSLELDAPTGTDDSGSFSDLLSDDGSRFEDQVVDNITDNHDEYTRAFEHIREMLDELEETSGPNSEEYLTTVRSLKDLKFDQICDIYDKMQEYAYQMEFGTPLNAQQQQEYQTYCKQFDELMIPINARATEQGNATPGQKRIKQELDLKEKIEKKRIHYEKDIEQIHAVLSRRPDYAEIEKYVQSTGDDNILYYLLARPRATVADYTNYQNTGGTKLLPKRPSANGTISGDVERNIPVTELEINGRDEITQHRLKTLLPYMFKSPPGYYNLMGKARWSHGSGYFYGLKNKKRGIILPETTHADYKDRDVWNKILSGNLDEILTLPNETIFRYALIKAIAEIRSADSFRRKKIQENLIQNSLRKKELSQKLLQSLSITDQKFIRQQKQKLEIEEQALQDEEKALIKGGAKKLDFVKQRATVNLENLIDYTQLAQMPVEKQQRVSDLYSQFVGGVNGPEDGWIYKNLYEYDPAAAANSLKEVDVVLRGAAYGHAKEQLFPDVPWENINPDQAQNIADMAFDTVYGGKRSRMVGFSERARRDQVAKEGFARGEADIETINPLSEKRMREIMKSEVINGLRAKSVRDLSVYGFPNHELPPPPLPRGKNAPKKLPQVSTNVSNSNDENDENDENDNSKALMPDPELVATSYVRSLIRIASNADNHGLRIIADDMDRLLDTFEKKSTCHKHG